MGTSHGRAKLAPSLRARRGLVGLERSYCRLPGTVPTQSPDTEAVRGDQEKLAAEWGAGWPPQASDPPNQLRCPIRHPRVPCCTS